MKSKNAKKRNGIRRHAFTVQILAEVLDWLEAHRGHLSKSAFVEGILLEKMKAGK